MPSVDDNNPVIIGIGCHQVHSDQPEDCPEPYQLMVAAIGAAANDAGRPELVRALESISVQQGLWRYKNPGRLIASALGCPNARSVLADLGVLQLTPLFDLMQTIAAGEESLGVVVGGEARYRELRAQILGQTVTNTEEAEDTPPPDVYHPTPDPFTTEAEMRAGISTPVEMFAVIESALRHQAGLDIDTHRDRLASMYSHFSRIAAANPHAWFRDPLSPAAIRNPEGKNSFLAFPYTKKHVAQWNINQAVAILVCSVAKARELGIDPARWVYPVAVVQSRQVSCLAEKPSLCSHAGTRIAGQRAYALAGINSDAIQAADLYSCFPAAVQSFANDLKLRADCPLSVTGSMAFAGGPFNHAALDSIARMSECVRSGEGFPDADRRWGLVSNLSGIFGKQAVAILSNQPNPEGFQFDDVSEQTAAAESPLDVICEYTGDARIVGCTVAFNRGEPERAVAYCDLPDGRRTVARSLDPEVLQAMMREEFVGKRVVIDAEGFFTVSGVGS